MFSTFIHWLAGQMTLIAAAKAIAVATLASRMAPDPAEFASLLTLASPPRWYQVAWNLLQFAGNLKVPAAMVKAPPVLRTAEAPGRPIQVLATREGLVGQQTASGYVIDAHVPFCALPCRQAVDRHVRLTNPANGKTAIAWVADVGPWNTEDTAYVMNGARPQAESGTDMQGRKTNGAGLDLGEKIWAELGMTDNGQVVWEFI